VIWDALPTKSTDLDYDGQVVNWFEYKTNWFYVLHSRLGYVYVIGKGNKPYVSLPKGKGVKLSIAEERNKRIAAKTT